MEVVRIFLGVFLLIFLGNSIRDNEFGLITTIWAILLVLLIVWAIVAKKREDKEWESSEAARKGRARQLSEKGVKAVAEIKAVQKAHAKIARGQEKNIGVILSLEVVPNTGEPFEMKARGLIEELNMAKFQPGNIVDLLYMPDDLMNFSIPDFETSEALTNLIVDREARGVYGS